jgi:hypothetical protein
MPRTVARKAAAVLVDDSDKSRKVFGSRPTYSPVHGGTSESKPLASLEAKHFDRLG